MEIKKAQAQPWRKQDFITQLSVGKSSALILAALSNRV